MKFKYDNKYLYWGVTAFSVICCSVMFFFLIYRMDVVKEVLDLILRVLSPIIYGLAMAYLLTPIYNFFEYKCYRLLRGRLNSERVEWGTARCVSTIFTITLALSVVATVIGMMLPQLVESMINVAESMPGNISRLNRWLNELLIQRPELADPVNALVNRAMRQADSWLQTEFIPNITSIVAGVSTSIMGVANAIMDLLVGVIICVYALNSKRTFAAQGKKVIYSLLSRRRANSLIEDIRFTHKTFGGFIYGKLLDSLIIGILCFVCISLMKMPYVMLISVVIGITNIIPFFGPFIGAIPSALLVLTVSPLQCVYFLVFVLILQQVDGNIIGPKILGDSTGLTSFWVIFAILLGGGLFGFPGMVLGVPVFAVIYAFISRHIDHSLRRKGLRTETKAYLKLDHVDVETDNYVERKGGVS